MAPITPESWALEAIHYSMKNNQEPKDQWLHLRLTAEEKRRILLAFNKTTQRKLSDYARKILLGKPMVASYRNESLDELMEELISLRKDLNGVANNFNQIVHKLHTLDHSVQILQWIHSYEKEQQLLMEKIESMRLVISKLGAKWLQ